jgi:hypothetical protein
VARYDWSVVSGEVLRVYQAAIAASTGRVVETSEPLEVSSLDLEDPGRSANRTQ